jgi:hypothetical protein
LASAATATLPGRSSDNLELRPQAFFLNGKEKKQYFDSGGDIVVSVSSPFDNVKTVKRELRR